MTMGTEQTAVVAAVDDALDRLARDDGERGGPGCGLSSQEMLDSVWGRLPVDVRRSTRREDVEAAMVVQVRRRRDVRVDYDGLVVERDDD